MIAQDWRLAGAGELGSCYDAEALRWSASLHWDSRSTWALVEAARRAGTLPGFVVRDRHGAIEGWTFYLRHRDALQIGAMVGASRGALEALVQAVLASPEADTLSRILLFAFPQGPELDGVLESHGFTVERYSYLEKPTGTDFVPARAGRAWRDEDALRVSALLAAAYGSEDRMRPFAPSGALEEWHEYVAQILTTTGCGSFLPRASVVLPGAGETPDGVAMVTRLAEDTAHVAQMAVAPGAQRRGLARGLMASVLAGCGAQGFARVTLLVGDRNRPARRLYRELGFEEAAAFVCAVRDQPRRSTSAALETGGAMILR